MFRIVNSTSANSSRSPDQCMGSVRPLLKSEGVFRGPSRKPSQVRPSSVPSIWHTAQEIQLSMLRSGDDAEMKIRLPASTSGSSKIGVNTVVAITSTSFASTDTRTRHLSPSRKASSSPERTVLNVNLLRTTIGRDVVSRLLRRIGRSVATTQHWSSLEQLHPKLEI